MANLYHVILLQSDLTGAQPLSEFFKQRGDLVTETSDAEEAGSLLRRRPDLAALDVHLPDNQLAEFLRQARQESPATGILVTSTYPDAERELQAKEAGAQVFLRSPFTKARIEQALKRLTPAAAEPTAMAPALLRVRIPVRLKLTLPYVLLAVAFAAAASYLVNRYVLESVQERFARQLQGAGELTADSMVAEERKLLETLRYVANTQGVPEAIGAGEAESLRDMALPIAVNKQEEAVEILDTRGVSLLSLRHVAGGGGGDYSVTRGDTIFTQWDFVQNVLAQKTDERGDKHAGVARAQWGDYFYIAGPIKDEKNQMVGVVLVGKSLPTLARQLRQETLAHITLYDLDGQVLASTFEEQTLDALPPEDRQAALGRQDEASVVREADLSSPFGQYSEIIGPWEVRGGGDLGLLGTSLTRSVLIQPTQITRAQAYVVVAAAFLLVIFVGVYLANQITRLLVQVAHASAEVAQGNLEVKVASQGDDEVAVLANSFNVMVSRLQEGSVYRDLLGRAVSPEVRDQLRQSFESGHLRLEGQTTEATVMMTDIRSFTTLSERQEPTTVLRWLNEYFGELVPIVTAHGGVVDKFAGDAMLAVFGILPRPLNMQESAYHACRAAQEMLDAIDRINAEREKRGDPPFITGIGINTGAVTAGGLGTSDRLNYTVIGDTVNTVQRLENFTRQLGASSAVIGQTTYEVLQDKQAELNLEALGSFSLKGKRETVAIYRLRSSGD